MAIIARDSLPSTYLQCEGLLTNSLHRHHAYKMTAVHQQPPALGMPALEYPSLNPPFEDASRAEHEASAPSWIYPRTPAADTQSVMSPSSPTPSIQPSRSFIGGVRRWISINQPEEGQQRDWLADVDRRAAKPPRPLSKIAESRAALRDTTASPRPNTATSTASAEPNSTAAVYARVCSPTISRQESREYQSYTTQFLDSTFDRSHRVSDADVSVYETAVDLAHGTDDGGRQSRSAVAPDGTQRNAASIDPVLLAHVKGTVLDGDTTAPLVPPARTAPPRGRSSSRGAPIVRPMSRGAQAGSTHAGAALGGTADSKVKAYSAWLHLVPVR